MCKLSYDSYVIVLAWIQAIFFASETSYEVWWPEFTVADLDT